jgi:hypothetical protein
MGYLSLFLLLIAQRLVCPLAEDTIIARISEQPYTFALFDVLE